MNLLSENGTDVQQTLVFGNSGVRLSAPSMALSHILYFRTLSSAGPTNLLLNIFMTSGLTIWFVMSTCLNT